MSGLYLNYCFCSLTDSDTDVFSIDYINHEQLSSLRKEYKDICFYRSGNAIYFWSLKNSDNVLAESLSTVKVNINPTEYPSVVSKMLEIESMIYSRQQRHMIFTMKNILII